MSRPALGPTQLFHWVYNSYGMRLATQLHVWLKLMSGAIPVPTICLHDMQEQLYLFYCAAV